MGVMALPVRIAEVERERWAGRQFSKLGGLAPVLRRRYERLLGAGRGDQAPANRWLRESVQRLRVLPGLSADAGDDAVRAKAEALAERAGELVRRGLVDRASEVLAAPLGIECGGEDGGARLACAVWWRRQLRRICARRAEGLARELGEVRRGSSAYVSEHGFRAWVSASRRNAAFLARCEAVNDAGQVFGLDELAALSVSNPVIRRAELMVRIRGAEEWAARAGGWSAVFVTVTCPSAFHARYSSGAENARFAGHDPRAGAEYLAGMWARCRADLARRGLDWWGLRVAEPHHDGTPHWHLLVYARPGDLGAVVDVMRAHALRQDGGEPGAARYRFAAKALPVGAAAGYVAKYVSKNVDGFGVGEDFEAGDFAADSAARVRAWASIWGIRQFSWIGAPAVTVWRELRRIEAAGAAGGVLGELVAAADAGDWGRYVELMGGAGPGLSRARPAVPWRRSDRVGRYGEPVERVVGVVCSGVGEVLTRWRVWCVRFGARSARALGLVSITVRGVEGGTSQGSGAGGAVVRGAGGSGGGAAGDRRGDGRSSTGGAVGDGRAGGPAYGFA
ncbi:MAG: hypothetical protein AMXMBFR26_06990 [Porticoccaceae bacterium]